MVSRYWPLSADRVKMRRAGHAAWPHELTTRDRLAVAYNPPVHTKHDQSLFYIKTITHYFFRENDFPGKWLSGKRLIRETSVNRTHNLYIFLDILITFKFTHFPGGWPTLNKNTTSSVKVMPKLASLTSITECTCKWLLHTQYLIDGWADMQRLINSIRHVDSQLEVFLQQQQLAATVRKLVRRDV